MKNTLTKNNVLKKSALLIAACAVTFGVTDPAFTRTVYAAENPDLVVPDGASLSQPGALGSIDVSSIQTGTKCLHPKDVLYTTFKAEHAKTVSFQFYYTTVDGSTNYKQCFADIAHDYNADTGLWTIKTVIPSNAACGTWKLFSITINDENGKRSDLISNAFPAWSEYEEATDLSIGDFTIIDAPAPAATYDAGFRVWPHYDLTKDGGTVYPDEKGELNYSLIDNSHVYNSFFYDGTNTYFLGYNGAPLKNTFSYHPDADHIIYFDENGHELFSTFYYCPEVGYTCYFGSDGYLYKDQITFVGDKTYYLDANGAMAANGWFSFANGRDFGYANSDGTLNTNGWGQDPQGRTVFYHWNGMVARGLITDGVNYYYMDETDGHYIGQFPVQ